MKRWLLFLISLVFVFTGLSAEAQRKNVDKEPSDYKKNGIASFYGGKFNGRPMANGEKYDEKS